MIETRRVKDRLYLAAVIALLLLMSLTSGYVSAAIAVVLFLVGLALYPNLRRTAIICGRGRDRGRRAALTDLGIFC